MIDITQAGKSDGVVIPAAVSGEEGVVVMNPIPRQGWRKNGSRAARLDTIVAFYVKAP
ncbi:MAG: hypothetical protein KGQ30_07335 [Burkholderiales bacterium]|nr:hypothetical protein [Burkholderiales bacterium]